MVRSLSDPMNREESSKSLTRSRTRAPRTNSLQERYIDEYMRYYGGLLDHSLSILHGPRTDTVEFPAKVDVQVVAHNMEDPSGDHFILRIPKLKDKLNH